MKLRTYYHLTAGNKMLYIFGAAVAVALKYHYSTATADDLFWMLYPTAIVVGLMTGLHFERETYAGFIDYSHGIIIAPACGGINFLIIAFCTAFFSYIHKIKPLRTKWLWFGIALASSYILTILVNSLRIYISIFLLENNVNYGWFSPDRVHRIEGVVVYFVFLSIFHLLMKKAIASISNTEAVSQPGVMDSDGHRVLIAVTPLFWYLLITLGLPLLNGSHRQPEARFAEHFWTVGLLCAIIILVVHFLRLYSKRLMYTIESIPRRWLKTVFREGVQTKQ